MKYSDINSYPPITDTGSASPLTTSSAAPIGSPVVVASTPTPASVLPSISAVPLSNTVLIAPNIIIANTKYDGGDYYDTSGRVLLGALPVTGLSAAGNTVYPADKNYIMGGTTCVFTTGSPATVYTADNKGVASMALPANAVLSNGLVTALSTMPKDFNNTISSIVVAANIVVFLHTQAMYGGVPVKIYGPALVSGFGRIGNNDKVQSIRAIRGCGKPLVTLFDGYYNGTYVVSVGRNEVADLRSIGFPLNVLTSVRVSGPCVVTLYPGLNYTGTGFVLTGTGDRILSTFNDRAQSLKITPL